MLSPRLAAQLEFDAAELAALADPNDVELRRTLAAELGRVVTRHGGTSGAGSALVQLAWNERSVQGRHLRPAPAALVARFLSGEAR